MKALIRITATLGTGGREGVNIDAQQIQFDLPPEVVDQLHEKLAAITERSDLPRLKTSIDLDLLTDDGQIFPLVIHGIENLREQIQRI